MKKTVAYIVAILVGVAVWYVLQRVEIAGLHAVRVIPKSPPGQEVGNPLQAHPSDPSPGSRLWSLSTRTATRHTLGVRSPAQQPGGPGSTLRIAALDLDYLGPTKASKPFVLETLSQLIRRYDVVALQGIRSDRDDLLPSLVDHVNRAQRSYDYLIGPRVGTPHQTSQMAFVFDRQTLITDRDEMYTMGDPHNLLLREPLVAWFRTRQAAAEQAFTFSLVNIHIDSRHRQQELNVMQSVLRRVLDDGRQEDDAILLGNFDADHQELGRWSRSPGLIVAIRGVPTTVAGNFQTANLIFPRHATDEFTGKSGVFDFLREWNLTVAKAREVTGHLPVWAEFSVLEGGDAGQVAQRHAPPPR
jgi:hypothetical protein